MAFLLRRYVSFFVLLFPPKTHIPSLASYLALLSIVCDVPGFPDSDLLFLYVHHHFWPGETLSPTTYLGNPFPWSILLAPPPTNTCVLRAGSALRTTSTAQ